MSSDGEQSLPLILDRLDPSFAGQRTFAAFYLPLPPLAIAGGYR